MASKYLPGDSENLRLGSFPPKTLCLLFMVFVFIPRRGKYQAVCHQCFGILCRPPVSWVLLGQCSCSFYIIDGTQFPLKKIALSWMRMFSHAGSPSVYILVTHWAIVYILVGKNVDQVFLKNHWLLNLTRWLSLYFLCCLSFVFVTWVCLHLTRKQILDCIYLRLSKIMGDRTAYLPTGGRNAAHSLEDRGAIRIPW